MSRILIAYGTSEGQTRRIAECIARVIREQGHEAVLVDVKRATPDPAEYDAVIVGASVHRGRHQTHVGEYVRETRDALQRLPTAFFSVSLAICGPSEAERREAEGYAAEFARLTQWQPGKVALFAGALLYTKYGFFTRWIMKRIARGKGSADLDTSRDYEYTDWDGVKRFAAEFVEAAVPAAGVAIGG
jgi:menaquinone-dependent protoporphyrinogen oxidase